MFENLGAAQFTGGTVNELDYIRASDKFGGLAYFFLATCTDPDVIFPSKDRIALIHFFTAHSPKYLYLLQYVYRLCRRPQIRENEKAKNEDRQPQIVKGDRCVVFFYNPMVQA